MKLAKLLLLSFFLLMPAASYSAESGKKTKIGVMEFKVAKKLDPSYGTFLYDMLPAQMVSSGRYRVVDWEEIDRVLGYIAKSQPNISQKAARKQAINQLGIQKMYIGSLTKVGSKFYMSIKVLNLDLTVERMEKGSAAGEEMLEQGIMQIAQRLLVSSTAAKRMKAEAVVKARAEAKAKAEEEKRKRIEAARGKEIGRDGHFIAYSKGIVIDTHTGLMWAARDNGSDITWGGARSYCVNYKLGGYTDWRMPTLDELQTLYDTGIKSRHGYHVTSLIDISDSWVWASETRGSEAADFAVCGGKRRWCPQSDPYYRRALPVRAGN
jgi:hypothetical protein